MAKINLQKKEQATIHINELEKAIEEYKLFYTTHLIKIKNRNEIIPKLYSLSLKFFKIEPAKAHFLNTELLHLKAEAEEFIENYFGNEVAAIFRKSIPKQLPKSKYLDKAGDSFWLALLASFTDTMEALNTRAVQEWNYQRNFIFFLNSCFLNYGLHPNILKRDAQQFKRFNLVVEHYYRSRKPLTIIKPLLTYDEFDKQFIKPYSRMLPIRSDGQLIPFDKISKVKITTTYLKDDEINLFAEKHNFRWSNEVATVELFVNLCLNETEKYHPNPFEKEINTNDVDSVFTAQTYQALKPYPSSLKLFKEAMEKFDKKIFKRNILDDLRLCLEDLLRQTLNNKKSLENQLTEIGLYQKARGGSPEIVNMLQKLIDYYARYQNNYIKHNDMVKESEIELVINLTSTFINYITKERSTTT